jgi:hypothetical protein
MSKTGNKMEARRIECARGHVLTVLKTEEGEEGDAFAREVMSAYDDTCLYCNTALTASRAPAYDFERWASRVDRYQTFGAPNE